jgi:hypothetical protein
LWTRKGGDIVNKKDLLVTVLLTFCLTATLLRILPLCSTSTTSTVEYEYDPWYDLNDDGEINLYDLTIIGTYWETSGTPTNKASLEYESGWIDITNKAGQHFNITHNLNSTDVIVDIQGKTTIDGGVHQRHLGGTDYTFGWNKTYGGIFGDWLQSMVQTSDGGYLLAGLTWLSSGIDTSAIWLVKTDEFGNMQWNKTYGGESGVWDLAYSAIQTCDGGYAVLCCWESFGFGLMKTDTLGIMQWNKTYEIDAWGFGLTDVIQTSDGGYALVGSVSYSNDDDIWLVKTDANGNMLWNKTYGGTSREGSNYLIQTSDGGYALPGSSSPELGVPADAYLVKTDQNGNMQWNKTYGGTYHDSFGAILQTSNGGYTIAGETESFGAGEYDAWLVRTDASGNILWNKTYGGMQFDGFSSLVQTHDGGYTLSGNTASFGAGSDDAWLVRTDAHGNTKWNRTYGGTDVDGAGSIVLTEDEGYAMAGITQSFDVGEMGDFWLIKTDAAGNLCPGFKYGLSWIDSTADSVTLFRGSVDPYWNYVRVCIWKIKETP